MASDNILVAVKARPFISKEKNEKLNAQWAVKEKCIYQIDSTGHRIGEPYSFGNTFVHAKQEVISIETQVFELMKIGNKIRKISGTNMSERSSRSHTIFRFTIESTDVDVEDGPVQISQLNLVDLAGSERISQSKVEGARLKEGVNINKSLLTLGNVIRQLSDNEGFHKLPRL
ncbi:hypothetical protein NQ318_009149 [Aromia moschata]|uniref:Kinesin motor domain-containing protein n=1 Tax=Aromia moschata TaxID=1265417 RepID=A0AAV8XGX7_9CUCU|nr:hypothetical protein NQ318_009149 [Aromia moschata]